MISKGRCTWTKPMDIAGTQTKEDLGTTFDEVHGNKSKGTATLSYYGQWRQDVRADTRLLDTEGQRGRECRGCVKFHRRHWEAKGVKARALQRQRCA